MFKKIFLAFFVILLTLPITSAFASDDYRNGLIDTSASSITKIAGNISFPERTYDNSLSTSTGSWYAGGTVRIQLDDIYHITGSYYMPDSNYLKFKFYDSNDIELANISAETGYSILNIPNVSYIDVVSEPGVSAVAEIDFFGYLSESIILNPISDLAETHSHNTVNLSWANPLNDNFTGVVIKRDGVMIANLSNTTTSYSVTGLSAETNYNFEVIAIYNESTSSSPLSISVTTDPPPLPEEIQDLQAEVEHNRVYLSWTLPDSDNFQHVNIYRDVITETAFIDTLLGIQSVSAAGTEIFETNGTYFNDLTVQPETEYEYTLTTTSTEGIESEGVTTTVTTPAPPIPVIEGGEFEETETGDYLYTWESPTTGQVKVLIDGQLYQIVNAVDRQILIPSDQMVFDIFGRPEVQLIPVDENGNDGTPSTPPSSDGSGGGLEDIEVPFTPNELLSVGTQLLFLVGGFVLLALAFVLVPKLRNLIVQAFSNRKLEKVEGTRVKHERKEREVREQREVRETRMPRISHRAYRSRGD